MADKKYFINNGASNIGPWSMRTIIDKVNLSELKATDQLCINVDNDEWMMICQHAEFVAHFEKNKPAKKVEATQHSMLVSETLAHPPIVGETMVLVSEQATLPSNNLAVPADLTLAQWFVLKGKNRFGPFVYVDLIRMLQEKSIFEFDYVWAQGLDKWKRIAEISIFSADHVRALYGSDTEDRAVFFRRNFLRSKYETALICHDNSKIWKGKTTEISEGGAGVVIENSLILPGQNVYLHFKPGQRSKSFNVLCEVVSKKFTTGLRGQEAPVLYGIKFINITKTDREAIRLIHAA